MSRKTDDSQIFAPFRSVGFVSNHIPLNLEAKGTEHFVTTVVGRSYHVYNCKKMKLAFVGESGDNEITAIASTNRKKIVAAGKTISIYVRGKKTKVYDDHEANVVLLLVLGDHVVSVDDKNNIHVWSHTTLDVHVAFMLAADFQILSCVHPSTYLNKVLFGSKQGAMQLWNVRTQKLIYEFKGWMEPVVTLEQSPAVDVIGIGLQSGRITLHNLRVDKTLMSFYQEFGLVTSITFRSDGQPIMATGSTDGHISLWNLEKKEIVYVEKDAHSGSVAGMKFFQKQPLLVTSSPDNSLKEKGISQDVDVKNQVWIFDNPDGSCRLLKSRCGHTEPPTQTLFYGMFGNAILTSGIDRTLRYTAIMRGEQCHEFSQGTRDDLQVQFVPELLRQRLESCRLPADHHTFCTGSLLKRSKKKGVDVEKLRLPPITCIAAEPSKEKDWDNVVTCHLGYHSVVTWNALKRSIGKRRLSKVDWKGITPSVVDISSCGNFCVVGYKNGSIVKFNLQSGFERGHYENTVNSTALDTRGISIDNSNMYIISSHADCTIKFWSFKDLKITDTVKCNCPITKSKLHRESSLLAVAFEDFSIQLYDIDTKNTVRQFHGHKNLITDISWSSDARWLVSSSMDGTIKTWDIPSARLIDCFLVDDAATSVAFSPSGEFLATTHQDNVGIYLWSNKVTYSGVFPTPLPNDYQPVTTIELPTTQIEVEGETSSQNDNDIDMSDDEVSTDYKSPAQLADSLITLSTLPDSRWKTLINLDLIKERNKPKEPPKKPKAAPFFLPTIAGVETTFDLSKQLDNEDDDGEEEKGTSQDVDVKNQKSNSKVMNMNSFDSSTDFQQLLKQKNFTSNVYQFLDVMKSMSPSQTDVEIRCLGPDAGGSIELLCATLQLFIALLKSGRDYELVQAYIALFLKLHGELIYQEESIRNEATILVQELKETWAKCDALVNQSACLVKYFKSATI